MEKEQIQKIIEKYRRKSMQFRRYSDEKCAFFERVADDIEDNINIFMDDDWETEEEILDNVKEAFDEVDNYYDDKDDFNSDNKISIVLRQVAISVLRIIDPKNNDTQSISLIESLLLGILSGDRNELIAAKAFSDLALVGLTMPMKDIKLLCDEICDKCHPQIMGLGIALDSLRDFNCSAEEALSQIHMFL